MRSENSLQSTSSAWIAASCVPGIGIFTGAYRETRLSTTLHVNKKYFERSEFMPENEFDTFRIRRIAADKIVELSTSRSYYHIAGLVQNLLSIAILATLIGMGIINTTSLNTGLVSGACGLFLMLALRNIYHIKQCGTDISKFGHKPRS